MRSGRSGSPSAVSTSLAYWSAARGSSGTVRPPSRSWPCRRAPVSGTTVVSAAPRAVSSRCRASAVGLPSWSSTHRCPVTSVPVPVVSGSRSRCQATPYHGPVPAVRSGAAAGAGRWRVGAKGYGAAGTRGPGAGHMAAGSRSAPASQARASAVSSTSRSSRSSSGCRMTGTPRSRLWVRARVVSVVPGPTSSRRRGSWSRRQARPRSKRTVFLRWSTQYSGSVKSASAVPVRLEISGTPGGARAMPRTTSRKVPSTGSTRVECAAVASGRALQAMPSAVRRRQAASMPGAGPDRTHASGPLTTARQTPSRSEDWRRGAPARTTSMAPLSMPESSSPLLLTRVSASGRDRTPARWAAAYSPRLWPVSTEGVTPQEASSRARATSVMKTAGIATRGSGSASGAASSPGPDGHHARRLRAVSRSGSRRRHASTACRNTGSSR